MLVLIKGKDITFSKNFKLKGGGKFNVYLQVQLVAKQTPEVLLTTIMFTISCAAFAA